MSKRILIFEDDEDYEQLITTVLSGSGEDFETKVAHTLREGLMLLGDYGPDLILADLNLPDCAGYETFVRIRELVEEVPIVVLTGLDDDKIALQAVEDGAQDYLVKSLIQPKLITRCVNMALSRQSRLLTRRALPSAKSAAVLAFIGSKGGVGTSTTAMNVAALLAQHGQALIIELQSGPGTASLYVQGDPPRGMELLLARPASTITQRELGPVVVEPVFGLQVLCAGSPGGARQPIDAAYAKTIIAAAKQVCPHVVLDLPPRIDSGVEAALRVADRITLVIDREPASIHCAPAMLEAIRAATLRTKDVRLAVVERTGLHSPALLADIKTQLRLHPQMIIPQATGAIAASQAARIPLVLVDPEDPFSVAHLELAERLLADGSGDASGAPVLSLGRGGGPPQWPPAPEPTFG